MANDPKTLVDVAEVRSALVYYFEQKAAYREQFAENREWDTKNAGYAKSLRLVVEHISKLPDDDPTLLALARCPHLYSPDVGGFDLPSSTGADMAAIHCGPRGRAMDAGACAEWFASWGQGLLEE
jgi:hypothetical protein